MVFYKFFYRPLMKLSHKFNFHWMQRNEFIDPKYILLRCHWCGIRSEINK